ncbi:MAG: hypothetical protein Q8R49_04920 [Rhodoferax sp.]|nr:hypothetical protein [Rhodoferax sp.]
MSIESTIEALAAKGIHSVLTQFSDFMVSPKASWWTCVVRTVAGRIEWRLPDPSCNVYAAVAATLAAGLNGVDQGMTPPSACGADLYELQAAGGPMPARLPSDLGAAVEALAADGALRSVLGEAFCHEFIKLKRREWDEYSQHVSDWELRRYADAF